MGSSPLAGGPDVDAAVKAAREAFDHGPWGTSAPVARAAILRRLGDLITESSAELAHIQVRENGKLIREVGGQARALAANTATSSRASPRCRSVTRWRAASEHAGFTVREPIGVVAAITPWNSPLDLLIMAKLAPALAAGCTVVVKPSEVTPAPRWSWRG